MMARAGGWRLKIWIAVAIGTAALLLANAHLVYVAVTTHPDCVIAEAGTTGTGSLYRPAKPGC